MSPVVALLTDFGTRDHYVGTMKGVVLGICRDAALVDITHDIPPQDVTAGALELAAAYRYFPADTVFLVVIDPGVGSSRRAIAARAGQYFFVGPDNGVFSSVFAALPPARVVELTDRRYALTTISRTFEGRDRFAPAAAHLATGVELSALGSPIADYRRLALEAPQASDGEIQGEVVRVDRFGNLVTNIDRAAVAQCVPMAPAITIAGRVVARLVGTYAEAADGELVALYGSSDHLEIAVSGGSASATLGLDRGAPVLVRSEPRSAQG